MILFLLLDISYELYTFSIAGEILYERFLSFIQRTIERQRDRNCDHDMTLVLFGRSSIDDEKTSNLKKKRGLSSSSGPLSSSTSCSDLDMTSSSKNILHQSASPPIFDWYDVIWCGPLSQLPDVTNFIQSLRERIELYNPDRPIIKKLSSSTSNFNKYRYLLYTIISHVISCDIDGYI